VAPVAPNFGRLLFEPFKSVKLQFHAAVINADFAVSALTLLVGRQEGHNGLQKQEAQLMLMLTNTRDVQSIYSVDIPVSLHLLQKKRSERRKTCALAVVRRRNC